MAALGKVQSDDPTYVDQTLLPKQNSIDIGTSAKPFGTIYADSVVADSISTETPDLTVYGAGTAYALTATPAAVTMGTTSPSLTLTKAGTYLIFAQAKLDYNGASFAASRTATIKLRRTNNTAADIAKGVTTLGTQIVTTETSVFANAVIPPVVYTTANDDDVIKIFGDVSVIPTAGSLDVSAASIVALRIA